MTGNPVSAPPMFQYSQSAITTYLHFSRAAVLFFHWGMIPAGTPENREWGNDSAGYVKKIKGIAGRSPAMHVVL